MERRPLGSPGWSTGSTCRCWPTSASSRRPKPLAELAAGAGITLIARAIAFVANHPAVTAPIIGPRTMENLESQLAAANVVLDEALLDRIDEIVATRPNLNPGDGGWISPTLEPAARRRWMRTIARRLREVIRARDRDHRRKGYE
jgi:hypothetical protein